ncbi:hypothetical protein HPB48_019978 [Haemaphysalis longicornis]|uniref:Peptidase M13 N-terminal domain-containing protein n=1 Tax=Haemaphysalis longicornis TaxID=44386 RepID=A0A9J6GMA3_HAELO|nr:hypothetical protein HPB48_019978 [Haemaphysalis longicornis]
MKCLFCRRYIYDLASAAEGMVIASTRQTAPEKAAKFYQSCTSAYAGGTDGQFGRKVKFHLSALGIHWPVLSNKSRLLDTIFRMTALWNCGAVVQFTMDRPGWFMIAPSTFFLETLRRREYLTRNNREWKYREYFQYMVEAFKITPVLENEPLTYEKFFELESEIVPHLDSAYRKTEPKVLRHVSMDAVLSILTDAIPRHAWSESLREHLNTSVEAVRVAVLHNFGFIDRFFELVGSKGEAKMAYYHGWVLAQALSFMTNPQVASYFYVNEQKLSRGRARYCVSLTEIYMGLALYAGYGRSHSQEGRTAELSELVANIRRRFWSKIVKSPWPDAAAVVEATSPSVKEDYSLHLAEENNPESLEAMYQHFPSMTDNFFDNVQLATLGRRRTHSNTRLPSFAHERVVNLVNVDGNGRLELLPLAFEMLWFPVDSTFQGAKAIQYGALGGHVADALSSLVFQRILELHQNVSAVADNIGCFGNDKFSIGHPDVVAIEKLTFLRRVAAARIPYETFLQARPSARPLRLPNHEDLTETQLFFIFWCMFQCDLREPNRDCNGPLKVLNGFAEAFQCKQRAATSDSHMCSLFGVPAESLLSHH